MEPNSHILFNYGKIYIDPKDIETTEVLLDYRKWWGGRKGYTLVTLMNMFTIRTLGKFTNLTHLINLEFDVVMQQKSLDGIQKSMYGEVRYPDVPAFMSKSRNTIFVDIRRISKKVLYHEIGHIIFNEISNISVCSDMHEYIAQYCER